MIGVPKKSKYKKLHKGKLKNIIIDNPFLKKDIKFGNICLITLEAGRIFPNQILNCKQFLNKNLKKIAKFKMNIFPHTPITKKPLEIRMGKGKGSVETWAANIFSGTKILEIESANIAKVLKTLTQIKNKLPIKTKIIYE
jgi:large subunit ribosomal protein L16